MARNDDIHEQYGMEKDRAYEMLKAKQEGSAKAKNVLRGAGYARGGGVSPIRKKHADEKEDKALIKKELAHAKIKVKHGGKIDGKKAAHRADKFARGGSVPRGHTKVVINTGASMADKQDAMKKGVALGAQLAARKMAGGPRPGAGAPMQARAPMPAPSAGPPGGAPMSGPPGVPPTMGAKCGGRMYAKGGKVGPVRIAGVPHLKGGAGGGLGRREKMASYGTKPKK